MITGAYGIGSVLGDLILLAWRPRFALRIGALALVGASCQAAIIGSGMGVWPIAALELAAGVCVTGCFTLWETSLQEHIPAAQLARVSSYDYLTSTGFIPLGTLLGGARPRRSGCSPRWSSCRRWASAPRSACSRCRPCAPSPAGGRIRIRIRIRPSGSAEDADAANRLPAAEHGERTVVEECVRGDLVHGPGVGEQRDGHRGRGPSGAVEHLTAAVVPSGATAAKTPSAPDFATTPSAAIAREVGVPGPSMRSG